MQSRIIKTPKLPESTDQKPLGRVSPHLSGGQTYVQEMIASSYVDSAYMCVYVDMNICIAHIHRMYICICSIRIESWPWLTRVTSQVVWLSIPNDGSPMQDGDLPDARLYNLLPSLSSTTIFQTLRARTADVRNPDYRSS